MNKNGDGRGSSGINIIWPDVDNKDYNLPYELAVGNVNTESKPI